MKVEIKTLSTGWYHLRGVGPCNWAQIPSLDCQVVDYAHPEASVAFVRAAQIAVIRARKHTL